MALYIRTMDKTAQDAQQTPVSSPARNATHSVAGGPQKELGPIGGGEATYLERTEQKPEISRELKELGVEAVHDELEVPYEAQKAGLTHAKEASPVDTTPQGTVAIPLNAQQSIDILKVHKNIQEAVVWLARWCLRQLQIKGEKA